MVIISAEVFLVFSGDAGESRISHDEPIGTLILPGLGCGYLQVIDG
jgi:hypothetical protein